MTCVKYDFPSRSCPKGGGSSASGAPPALGNPIQVTGGIKTETHLDYATADGLLTVRREFLNQFLGWRMPGGLVAADLYASAVAPSPFAEDITVERWNGNVNYTETMTLLFPYMRNTDSKQFRTINPDGSNTVFVLDADGASGTDMNGERVEHLATSTVEGAVWRRIRGDDASDYYDANGLLRKIQLRSGLAVVYRYDSNNRLEEMQDSWGRRILYHHGNDGLLERITLPDGGLLTYAYEEKRLSRVTYPDGSSRRYLYNEEDNVVATSLPPVALTGVIDEKGVRAATYRYDSARRAYSTESAGGVNKYTFSYGSTYTSVTDPLGSVFTFYFSTIQSRKVLSSQNQPAGAGCAAAAARFTYDSNGNVASHTDWNGIKTTYAYDLTRNLETSKTEAAGSATAKTTSTQWHPSYRLPIAIAEPGKLTTFSYDSHGNLLTRSESATSDATGILAFNAVPTGTAQTWRFTYNDVGQVLTRRGPRTDLDDSVSYTYDEQGNLARVTNAAGQTTTFADYDANGRAGTVTDANGLVTALTYTARGRLASHTVEGDTTRYDYDGVGQLTGVSLPDGSSLTYTYDDAHRLTAIADRLGNRLAYTLDQVGNRIDQHASDPNGILARQTSRVYDSLNHLQQLTGGGQ